MKQSDVNPLLSGHASAACDADMMKRQFILVMVLWVSLSGVGCERMRSSRQVHMADHPPAMILDDRQTNERGSSEGYTEAGYPVSQPGPGEGSEIGERVFESFMMAALLVGFMFLNHELERDRDKRRAKMWRKYKR